MQIDIKQSFVKRIFDILDVIDEDMQKDAINLITTKTYERLRHLAKPHFREHSQLEKNIRHKISPFAGVVWVDDENMLVNWNSKKINYVEFVLNGTKPHIIKPKNKKFLRFYYKNLNHFIYSKGVMHPGYKGDDFVKRAKRDIFLKLDYILKDL